MTRETGVTNLNLRATYHQDAGLTRVQHLKRHEIAVQLRVNDLRVKLGQLREEQALASLRDRPHFNQVIADAEHEYAANSLEYDATHAEVRALEIAGQAGSSSTVQHPGSALFGPQQLTGVGVFLLMLPIVFAYTRRIWMRSGVKPQRTLDPESSPRLQRMEQAIETIALEVERIGEAQRFTTKLLTDRRPSLAIERVTPSSSPSARREPGTITPH